MTEQRINPRVSLSPTLAQKFLEWLKDQPEVLSAEYDGQVIVALLPEHDLVIEVKEAAQ